MQGEWVWSRQIKSCDSEFFSLKCLCLSVHINVERLHAQQACYRAHPDDACAHISELMQTEVHHIQTLLIMSEVFRKGMKEELQLDHSTVDKIFPCLDELLETHRHFFFSMKERRQESCVGHDRNFVINRIGDILVQQVRRVSKLVSEP